MKLVDHIKAFRAWAERRGSAIDRSSPAHDAIDFAEKFGLTTREYHRLHYLMEEAKDGRWPDAWRPSSFAGERTLFNSRLQPARWWVGQREDGSWELQKARSAMRFPWINVIGPYPSKKVAQRAMRAANIKERLKPKKVRMLFNAHDGWTQVAGGDQFLSIGGFEAQVGWRRASGMYQWWVRKRSSGQMIAFGDARTSASARSVAESTLRKSLPKTLFNPGRWRVQGDRYVREGDPLRMTVFRTTNRYGQVRWNYKWYYRGTLVATSQDDFTTAQEAMRVAERHPEYAATYYKVLMKGKTQMLFNVKGWAQKWDEPYWTYRVGRAVALVIRRWKASGEEEFAWVVGIDEKRGPTKWIKRGAEPSIYKAQRVAERVADKYEHGGRGGRMLFNPRESKYEYRWYPAKGAFWADVGRYYLTTHVRSGARLGVWDWFVVRREPSVMVEASGQAVSLPEAKSMAELKLKRILGRHPQTLFNPEQSILSQGKIVIEWRAPTSRRPALYEWRVYLLTTFTHGEHAGQRGFWGPAASGLARTRAQARAEAKKAYSRLVRTKPRMLFNPNIMTMPRGEIRVEGVLRGRRGQRRWVYPWHVFLRGQKAPVAAGVSASHMKAYERGQEAYEEAVRRTPRMMF